MDYVKNSQPNVARRWEARFIRKVDCERIQELDRMIWMSRKGIVVNRECLSVGIANEGKGSLPV